MKREEKTKLTKEKIIAAAIDEFGSKGYAMASINNICDAGIAKGLIYHNFENKDALYIECLKICFNQLVDELSKAVCSADYKKYLKARYDLFQKNKNKANMILEALINPPEIHRSEIVEIRRLYDQMNLDFFRQILGSHNLRNGVDKESAIQYFAMMQDMFNWYFASPRHDNRSLENMARMHEENLPKMIDYMLYGIVKGDDEV